MAQKVKVKASRSRKQQLLNEHRRAAAERRTLAKYLKAAGGMLSKAERELLSEFVELAKQKCDRLRRAIRQRSASHAA
jgi:hypothetical protein